MAVNNHPDNVHNSRRVLSKELQHFLGMVVVLIAIIGLYMLLVGILEYIGKRFEIPYMSRGNSLVCWKCGSPGSTELIEYNVFALGGPTAVSRAPGNSMMVGPRPIPGVYCEACAAKMIEFGAGPQYWGWKNLLKGLFPWVIGFFSIVTIVTFGIWIRSLLRRRV